MALLAAVAVMVGMTVPQPHIHGVSADLPKVGRAISMPHAIVMIMRNGDVFFRNGRVSPERLAHALRAKVDGGSERKDIRADARALYRNVKQVRLRQRFVGGAGACDRSVALVKNSRSSGERLW
jgi:biopolymer transport protein ExbD